MNVIRRIAVPCGIVGGSWAILLSILLSLIIPTRMVTTTTIEGQTWGFTIGVAESWAWAILTIIIFMALMGLLGLLAMILSKRKPRLSRIFIWISALAMLVISLVSTVSMVSVGIILLPASILLMLAAIGLRKGGIPAEEAVLRREQP